MGKETIMSNNKDHRVLVRKGARQLTKNEIESISGNGGGNTHASLLPTGTPSSPDTMMDS
jgi:riboflavin biosynthesis pyrimidine reductase